MDPTYQFLEESSRVRKNISGDRQLCRKIQDIIESDEWEKHGNLASFSEIAPGIGLKKRRNPGYIEPVILADIWGPGTPFPSFAVLLNDGEYDVNCVYLVESIREHETEYLMSGCEVRDRLTGLGYQPNWPNLCDNGWVDFGFEGFSNDDDIILGARCGFEPFKRLGAIYKSLKAMKLL